MLRRIGAHVSAAGGVDKAIARAAAIGANCVALFSGSPKVWAKPPLEQVKVDVLKAEQARLDVTPVVTHALYLVNLASDRPEQIQKSVNSLTYELQFDGLIGGAGVVVHLGSHQGRGFAAMREQLVDLLAKLLAATPENSKLLIENAAGHNGKIGGDLEEIAWLLNSLEKHGKFVSSQRIGWCFDTCHAHAAGYALGSAQLRVVSATPQSDTKGGQLVKKEPLLAFSEMTRLGLLDTLTCIHVNDSRDPFASGRDRHANLGDGFIPKEDLQEFLTQPAFEKLPMILEVPGIVKGTGPDAENIQRLQGLLVN